MSRSNYSDDFSGEELSLYRGAVASATRGRRGQRFFRDLLAALDAMPINRLIADALVKDGEYCALGVVGARRGLALGALDPDDTMAIARAFDIAPCLAAETAFENDEAAYDESPERRWGRVRAWAARQIKEPTDG